MRCPARSRSTAQLARGHAPRCPLRPRSCSPLPAPPEVMLPAVRSAPARQPGAPGQLERHETPDPVRSDAVESRFQCVRHRDWTQWNPGSSAFGTATGRSETLVPVRSAADRASWLLYLELSWLLRPEPRYSQPPARSTAAPRPEPGEHAAGPRSTRRGVDSVPAPGTCCRICLFLQTAYFLGLRYDGMWTVY